VQIDDWLILDLNPNPKLLVESYEFLCKDRFIILNMQFNINANLKLLMNLLFKNNNSLSNDPYLANANNKSYTDQQPFFCINIIQNINQRP